jgi:hypothetical protein
MFDGTDFPHQPPHRPPVSDTVLTIVIVIFAMAMLITPISLAGLVDIIAYLRGR